jgi:hypothetical protein
VIVEDQERKRSRPTDGYNAGALSGLSHCLPAEFTPYQIRVTLLSDNAHDASGVMASDIIFGP